MASPPMVGVPDFFIWALGPSSLIVWPNFSFLRNGIRIGHRMALMANEINTDMIAAYFI